MMERWLASRLRERSWPCGSSGGSRAHRQRVLIRSKRCPLVDTRCVWDITGVPTCRENE